MVPREKETPTHVASADFKVQSEAKSLSPPPFFSLELQMQMQVKIGNGKDVTMLRYQVVEGSLLTGSSIGMCWLRPPESGVDLGYTHLYQFNPVALPTPFLSFLFFTSLICPFILHLCALSNNLDLFALESILEFPPNPNRFCYFGRFHTLQLFV